MSEGEKPVIFTTHALTHMRECGAREEDVREAIRIGEREPAQRGLFSRHYGVQQIVPIVAEEESRLVVVTVYTFFFQEGDRE